VMMIVAGIHRGSEANTTTLAEELIDHLTPHPELLPASMTLYVLPRLNPDGTARITGTDGRTNAHGVDLNRNWPALWVPQWDRSGCRDLAPTTGGSGPAFEPETMSLIPFIAATDIDALISCHSAALGIFPGGLLPERRSLALARALAEVSDYPDPPVDTGCVFAEQLIDWAAGNGIAAVNIDLHNHRNTDLEMNVAVLQAFLNWEGWRLMCTRREAPQATHLRRFPFPRGRGHAAAGLRRLANSASTKAPSPRSPTYGSSPNQPT
jgi:Zinc carboxypeptidase